MRIKQLLQRYNADDSGAVVIIVALFLTAAVGFMAVGIDLGSLYFRQKTLQTQADMAAVSAVLNLYDEAEDEEDEAPRVAATQTVSGNALSASALTGLSYGRYDYDSAVLAEDRFTEGSLTDADVNAAKAELADSAPLFFAKSFLKADSTPLSASATAARFDFASFSLGSRLLSLDTGESVLDGLLGGALGASVDLDVLDYNALLDTQVDLLTFSDALGNRIGATAGDYENILTSDIDLADVAGALLDTGLVSGSTDVLTTILNGTASTVLNASDLIGIDGDNIAVQLEDILGEVEVNALDLLKASLDVVNKDRVIEIDNLSLSLPNLLNTDLKLVVGEREAHSGWIILGARGATLHTAQVRLKLDLKLATGLIAGVLPTGATPLFLNLPLYVEVASATATLTELNCRAGDPSDTIATFDTGFDPFEGVTGTHLVELFIGNFPEPTNGSKGPFEDMTTPLNLDDLEPVNFLTLDLLGIIDIALLLRSHAAAGISQQPTVEFLVSEIGGVSKTIESGDILNSTLRTLLDPDVLELTIDSDSQSLLGGLLSSLLNPVFALLNPLVSLVNPLAQDVLSVLPSELLGALLTPLDAVIDSLLNTLGIGIGQGDLTLDGVSCGKVVLVQ
ncbi:TadG family pilus assembly protein [Celeribacter halophilus]|uniref:TadG family pilus assembly protein n=1 Tax=Celeribacter halophilus TaxID=576117 RepID=UPI003A8E46C6